MYPDPVTQTRQVNDLHDLTDFIAWVYAQPWVAVDTETDGLHPHSPGFTLRLAQIATVDTCWLFDMARWADVLRDLFRTYPGQVVMHNARFDYAALGTVGVKIAWRNVDDTLLAMRLGEPHLPAGLKEVATRHLDRRAADPQTDLHEAMRRNRWDWGTVPITFPPYLRYAAADAMLTARLYATDMVQTIRPSDAYRLELDVRALCCEMEATGLRVDLDHCRTERTRLTEQATTLANDIHDRFGISVRSPEQVARWLIGSDARPLMTRLTPAGKPSADEETLTTIIGAHRGTDPAIICKATLQVRKAIKLASTYLTNMIDGADDNGIVHPDIETMAARTGRTSIRNPALQTLPKPSSDPQSRIVRQAVIPRHPGDVLLSCDLDQVEMRLAASLSGDPGLIAAFATADSDGADDFFTLSARDIYRDPTLTRTDPRRKLVKSVWYGGLYGAGALKMAITAGVPLDRMTELRKSITDLYPGFWRLGKEAAATATANRGWIMTPYGRRLMVDKDRMYAATNYLIQGTANEVFKRGLVLMGHAGLGRYMAVPVHDEIVLSVPRGELEDVRHEVTAAMSNRDFVVPVTAHASGALATWADA